MSDTPQVTVKMLGDGRWVTIVKHPKFSQIEEYGPNRQTAIDKALGKLQEKRAWQKSL